MVTGRVIGVFVDTHHERGITVTGRSGDDHLGRASFAVSLSGFLLREETGGLDHDIDAEIGPGKISRVAFAEHLQDIAVDTDAITGGLDFPAELAMHRVVGEQVCHRLS